MAQRPEIINGRDVLRADRDRSPRRRHAANAEDAADIAAEDNAIADDIARVTDQLSREARADARAEAIAANIAEEDAIGEDGMSVSFTMDVGVLVPPTVVQAVADAVATAIQQAVETTYREAMDRYRATLVAALQVVESDMEARSMAAEDEDAPAAD